MRSFPARKWAESPRTDLTCSKWEHLSVQSPPLAGEWEASVWGPFPQHRTLCGRGEVGLRKAVQIPGGPQAQFSGRRTVTHGTLAPTWPNPNSQGSVMGSLVSLRLEGSIQETWGSCSHLISQTPGDDCRVGLPAEVGLYLCPGPPGARRLSGDDRCPCAHTLPPRIPRYLGGARSLAQGCFHRVCFCSVFCSMNRRGQCGHW